MTGSNHKSSVSSSLFFLWFSLTLHIHLIILISVRFIFNSCSTIIGQVTLLSIWQLLTQVASKVPLMPFSFNENPFPVRMGRYLRNFFQVYLTLAVTAESNFISSNQFTGPSTFHGLWHYPMCSPHPAVFHILSPFLLHLIIFHQHFSISIFHTIYSYYILPGFCHLLCNPVDIPLSCCTIQLTNKLLPCLFLCKSNTSPCISSCRLIILPIIYCFGLCHIL